MKAERAKPGPRKGVSRKPKRALDAEFATRLKAAMTLHPKWTVPLLAHEAGCTRAVLGKYLNGKSTTIEALLLDQLARTLEVSAGWLLTGAGTMSRKRPLTPDEERVLNVLANLVDEKVRDFWITQGEELAHMQPPLFPSAGNPYRQGPPKTAPAIHEPGEPARAPKPRADAQTPYD